MPQHQAAKALKTEPTPGQQTSPFQASAAATAGAAAPVKVEANGNSPVDAVQSVSTLVDLTSPTGPRPMEPLTVDLTNEVSFGQRRLH